MDDTRDIAETLGVTQLSQNEQAQVIAEYEQRVGELIDEALTDEQQEEYESIINGDVAVIADWLEKNIPDYRSQPAYQAFAEEQGDIPADKVYASMAWIQVNYPNYQTVVERVAADVRAKYAIA